MELAQKLRPKSFEDFLGQSHLVGKDAPLRKLVEQNKMPHAFFYGPSGVGKTSLARVIANELHVDFFELNATSFKTEELRKIINRYTNSLIRPVIFIDEVHRLSKTQQEVLLPFMEQNTITLLGASTSNPYYTLTQAIRSRSLLFELTPLGSDELEKLLKSLPYSIEADAKEYLIKSSGGDVRAFLNLLEFAADTEETITLATLKSLRSNPIQTGMSEKESHYDTISAFIKSVRGSDLDASIYYLACMIEQGESADFIARRLVILASEDIGLANPQALNVATSALLAVEKIGFPEARIILSEATLYLASSPKSNTAYKAINAAQKALREGLKMDIPKNIVHNKEGYLYPHDFGGYVKQQYMQKEIKFVELQPRGYEKKIKEWYAALGKIPL